MSSIDNIRTRYSAGDFVPQNKSILEEMLVWKLFRNALAKEYGVVDNPKEEILFWMCQAQAPRNHMDIALYYDSLVKLIM